MPPNSYLLYEICYLKLADKSTLNSAEGGIIKQMGWLINSFRHTSRLRAMNLDNVSTVIGNYTYKSSPTKIFCYQLLSEYIETGIIIPSTIVDKVLKIGFSLIYILFHNVYD